MITTKPARIFAALALFGALSALGGCADKADPSNIDRRAVERWNYLIARQAEKAYDYLTPGFRETQDRETYARSMNGRPVRWKSVKFSRKECDAETCKVFVAVTYGLTMPGAIATPVESTSNQEETWILSGGEWYFLPK